MSPYISEIYVSHFLPYSIRTTYLFLKLSSKEFNLEIVTNKTKVFGFVGTDHLRTKIIIKDEILEQVNQFTYLGCSLSYQRFNDVEFKLAEFS